MSTPLKVTDRVPFESTLGTDISHANDVTDALRIANLDWGLIDVPNPTFPILCDDGVINASLPDRRLLVRDDNGVVLSTVGSRYVPLSNADVYAIADHARTLGARFDSAGETNHGRTTFLTMTIPEASVRIGGHDPIDYKVILSTSNDGGVAMSSVTARRRVCTNGLTIGIGVPQTWNIRHSASAEERLVEARNTMTGAIRYAKEFTARAEQLAATPMTTNEYDAFLAELDPRPDEDRKTALTRWENRRSSLMELWSTADTQEEGRHTRWAALNAVAEWLDWEKPARGGANAVAMRQLNDSGAATRQRAYRLLQPA
ncbi:DUF932 domain-containing protein [Dietzia sp. 179-F 9C3 NHS]|uniref:DUF932 domain-containing protein n=1 Tax=Dietzia sp. 179-F 9C3 NHS TaxID=3374295 RepID=UPI00387A12E3